MKSRTLAGLCLVLALAIALILVINTSAWANTDWNKTSYWEAQYPGTVCTKYEPNPSSDPDDYPNASVIIVKGGPVDVAPVVYTPPFPDELTAAINPSNERPYGVSHVIACLPTQSPTTITTTPSSSEPSTPSSSTSPSTIPTPSTQPSVPTTTPTSTSLSSTPTTTGVPETTGTTDSSVCALTTSADSTTTTATEGCTPGETTTNTLPFTGPTLPVSPSILGLIAGVLTMLGFALVRQADVH